MHRLSFPDVLLCGFRRGLAKALDAEGLSYAVLEKKPFSCDSPFLLTTFFCADSDEAMLTRIAEQYREGSVQAVIAAKEWAVLPAAKLRQHLGLSGNSVEIAENCTDKFKMKERAREWNIPTTSYARVHSIQELNVLKRAWGFPVVAKLLQGSGSRGLFFIDQHYPDSSIDHWNDLLFEKFITGKEVSMESFLVNGEILFSNLTQYYEKSHINVLPFQNNSPEFLALQTLNQRVIQAMGIRNGMTHAEYYLTKQGILLGEIAVRPPGGYIMGALTLAYGFDAWQAMLKAELGDGPGLRKLLTSDIQQFVAVHVIHPGAGIVQSIEGYDSLIENGLALKVKLKLRVGQTLGVRQGLGSDFGTVIQVASSYEEIISKIDEMQKTCRINLVLD